MTISLHSLICMLLLLSTSMVLGAVVDITPVEEGAMEVRLDGELFTVYHPQTADRPFFYPVLSPEGQHMTRRWPIEQAEGEEEDHRHHRGLWYTHGAMNGHDFWQEGRGPKIVQTKAEVEEGGVLVTESNWLSPKGETVCTDRRVHRFNAGVGYRQLDLTVTLIASSGRLVMGDTKEGSMAVRVPATLRVKGEVAEGSLLNSEGLRDGAAWGKRAGWCAAVGPVDGKTVGVTIMDHPSNPRHPTWWHARDYGLLAANAVGQHYFEKKPRGAGDLIIEPGESVTFRYRVLIHSGDTDAARIADRYRAFCSE